MENDKPTSSPLPPVQAIHDLAAARLRNVPPAEDPPQSLMNFAMQCIIDLREIKRIAEQLGAEDTHG